VLAIRSAYEDPSSNFLFQQPVRRQVSGRTLREQEKKKSMNENEKYIADSINTWIWSGFYEREQVQEMIEDILEVDVDEVMLRKHIDSEWAKKKGSESSWPGETDCNRLDNAFSDLNRLMIVALQNAGYTTSDGHEEVGAVLAKRPKGTFIGYCFYHGQDLERAVKGDKLFWLLVISKIPILVK